VVIIWLRGIAVNMCTLYTIGVGDTRDLVINFFANLMHKFSCNLYTKWSPKEGDDTRCCTNTIVLLKMSIIVVETCRGM